MKSGGISSTWWVTRTRAGAARSAASSPRRRTRSSRPPRSRPAAGSSSSSSSGSVISARAICTRLRSPSRQGAEAAVGEVVGAQRLEQLVGAALVEPVVGLAPAPDHPVRGGDDDVEDRLVRRGCARPARPRRGRSAGAARRRRRVPSTSPRMPTTPVVGWMRAEASCSSVVLPAPLGPSTTQRWPSSTSQLTSSRIAVSPRTTLTPANARTSLMPRTLTESGREHPSPQDVQVHLVGLLADRAPGERLRRPVGARPDPSGRRGRCRSRHP